MFYEIVSSEIFRKFHRKTAATEFAFFFIKMQALKKDSMAGIFPVNFPKLYRTLFIIEHLQHLEIAKDEVILILKVMFNHYLDKKKYSLTLWYTDNVTTILAPPSTPFNGFFLNIFLRFLMLPFLIILSL